VEEVIHNLVEAVEEGVEIAMRWGGELESCLKREESARA